MQQPLTSSSGGSNVDLEIIKGHGPLSKVINKNSDFVKERMLTREEAASKYLTKNEDSSVDINGDFSTKGDAEINGELYVSGNITVMNEITATSDCRVKDDLLPISGALRKVLDLNGYSYTRKDWEKLGVPRDQRFIGLIAQEVQEVIPEVVRYNESTDLLSVNYPVMVALLVEAMKDLYKLV